MADTKIGSVSQGSAELPPCQGGTVPDTAEESEPVPVWLAWFNSATAELLDVRPILMEGREPIADVLTAAERIPEGGGLVVSAPFNPVPLRSLLHGRGLETYGSRLGERNWSIRVVRAAAPPQGLREKRPPPPRAAPGSALKLRGATQRLLPELIPLRFFGVAVFAHAASWAGIFIFAEALPGFHGGAGPVLGVLHVAVLGILLATAMGASFQMLPVALALPPPANWICDVTFALLVGGGAGLISGFIFSEPWLLIGGGGLLGGAVGFYLVTVAGLALRSGDYSLFQWHIATALVALAVAAALAIGLALDFRFGGLNNHHGVALAHFILAGFGFMGLFVMGFSQILVPMFAVAEPAGESWAWAALGLAVSAIAASAVGVLTDTPPLLIAGITTGLGAALCHIRQMIIILKGRMRTRLGQEFVLIKTAWMFLLLSLCIGLLISLDIARDTLASLLGFTLIWGWYLTMLLGVLQRILPFLASMHAARLGAKTLSPAKLTSPTHLTLHQRCHWLALLLVGIGLIIGNVAIIRLGALAGLAGAISFIVFGFDVLKRTRTHLAGTPA